MHSTNISIYVGNLSLEITEDELRREFACFGDVVSITIADDTYLGSGQQRRYAYLQMASKSESETAIDSLDGKKIKNSIVTVIRARPLSPSHEKDYPNKESDQINKRKKIYS